MKKNLLMLGIFILLFSINGFSQQKNAKISFTKEVYQMGTVKEVDGSVECTFEFTNIGGDNLTITNVKGDYGLVPTQWPKEAIVPGGKGEIKAKYNPQKTSGRVNKKLIVTSNSEQVKKTLSVVGNVIPKPKSIAEQYRQQMGNGQLRLKKKYFSLGNVMNTKVKKDSSDIINNGDNNIKISFKNIPKYVTIVSVPEILKPQEKGKIYLTYNASKNVGSDGSQHWGSQSARINVILNDQIDGRANYLTIRANIQEDFSSWTPEQLAAAPSISFDKMEYDFGTVNQGKVVKYQFKFKNNGKNDLEIRKVKGSWGCTAVSKTDSAVKKGESSEISVTFNTRGKRNKQHKTITVNTNDPKNPVVILKMVGNVVVPTTPANKVNAPENKNQIKH